MENQVEVENANSTKEDDIPKEFNCCICLDLMYKPVVIGCGHMACFWCIYKVMDVSECPVCRTPFNYFPRICRLLHLMLRKLYPLAYERREKEVSEEEHESGKTSQQVDDHRYEASDSAGITTCSEMVKSSDDLADGPNMEVETSDLTCAVCKQLLCRPVVLNCGDVYCEACIFNSSDAICKCPVCQSPHPNGFPGVCWALEHFLERQLPQEYADRKKSVLEHLRPPRGSSKPDPSLSSENVYASWFSGEGPPVHFAGCDYCGICPIVGKRYRCKDCKETMGFDLCEGCYNSPCKLPGRFNQQHKEDHQFELVEISMAEAINIIAAAHANGLENQGLEVEEETPSTNVSETNDRSEQTPSNIDSSEDEGRQS